jgi:hypothetical protein
LLPVPSSFPNPASGRRPWQWLTPQQLKIEKREIEKVKTINTEHGFDGFGGIDDEGMRE